LGGVTPGTVARTSALTRMIWGVTLLVAPRRVLRLLGGRETRLAQAVLRVLGTRQVLQAAVTAVRPSRVVLLGGVGLDGLHALTGLGLAVVDPSQARIGVTDAGIAATWIGVDLRALRNRPGVERFHRHRQQGSRWQGRRLAECLVPQFRDGSGHVQVGG
jgi:hypothetical protein